MPKNPASPTTINPPEGWKDGGGGYFMQALEPTGEKVSLVRFQDVVQWLIAKREEPYQAVMRFMATQGQTSNINTVYFLKRDDYAEKVAVRPIGTGIRIPRDGERVELLDERGKPVVDDGRTAAQIVEEFRVKEVAQKSKILLDIPPMPEYLQPAPFHGTREERLAVTWQQAHAMWGWGTVANAGTTVDAAGPAFSFSQAFIALCKARKTRKGDAWTNDEKATLYDEVQRFPKRKSGLFDAMANALGLATAEAVRLKARQHKQAQDDARQAAAGVTQVRGGKKVINQ